VDLSAHPAVFLWMNFEKDVKEKDLRQIKKFP
jgi:hypothetical protein